MHGKSHSDLDTKPIWVVFTYVRNLSLFVQALSSWSSEWVNASSSQFQSLVTILVWLEQATVEVWEVEQTKQTKVVSGVLENSVSKCCVLHTSSMRFCNVRAVATSMQGLDILLVNKSSLGSVMTPMICAQVIPSKQSLARNAEI